ncbi:kinase-like protein [Aspergillus steynii IBT 23096]|uniref:non-specific serine/threonine protein kinase n=1 Tax=Aspergillus steynii IBT 23096 TaxID=1392250 RepID=A0A2I2G9Z4_9EURO|nr:kinase-like protein [Aspergillus steynii IBT 23096]PLB49673.1 kinase-like protein [Aspergillus steynii IBT 23096]
MPVCAEDRAIYSQQPDLVEAGIAVLDFITCQYGLRQFQSSSRNISEQLRRHTIFRCSKISTSPASLFRTLTPRGPCFPIIQSLFCPQHLKWRSSARQGSTIPENHRIEYNWIKGVETLEKYRPGGYHPLRIGDVLNNRYQVADKLGFGGYSTVWLALDTHLQRYVAVKVTIADSVPRETNILKTLSAPRSLSHHPGSDSVPVILDEFTLQGPNGIHSCYAMTPAQCNLRDKSFSRLFPLDVARTFSYRLAQAVAYTHSRGYVHGETVPITRYDGGPFPSNAPSSAVIPLFLGKYAEEFTLNDARPVLSDFGEAFPASEPRLGQDCHTPPAFRAPEAKFQPLTPLSYPSDIWSLATAIWEIIGMKAVFSTEFVPEDEIIAQQVDVLGSMPSEWWTRWDGRARFFDDDGCPTDSYVKNKWPTLEGSFEEGVQKWRRRRGPAIQESEKAAFLDLMRRMLSFRPEERPTAEEVLESEWMVEWAAPDCERGGD